MYNLNIPPEPKKQTAQDYMDQGYFVVSRKYGTVARIDRPDWKEYMAKKHSGNLKAGMEWIDALGEDSAADHYRRVHSNDTIDITDHRVLKDIINSRDATRMRLAKI